jgi:hypothetical protein
MHVFFQVLWEYKYKKICVEICNHFLVRLYYVIFREECSRLSNDAKGLIKHIGSLYVQESYMYIRIFSTTGPPYLLLKCVIDCLVIEEISYQTFYQKFNVALLKEVKKKISMLTKVGCH